MEKINLAIIGGGAAGLFLASRKEIGKDAVLFERGERLGRKLSATGNGQGNLTNRAVGSAEYFSVQGSSSSRALVREVLAANDDGALIGFFQSLGVATIADERGRVYPSGRQASALTDALRFAVAQKGISVRLQTQVVELQKSGKGFLLTLLKEGVRSQVYAERVVLCAGGKAAKNFGTDGSAYALATGLGHSLTPLYPSLVQLKTQTQTIKTLKGIRVAGGKLTVCTPSRSLSATGDIIFTDYGVSGDSVFRLSAFFADEIATGKCTLSIDFLPSHTETEILQLLRRKKEAFPSLEQSELLFGIVNNQIGRAIFKAANGELTRAAALVKNFPLTVTGSLGFDYAQVTKGGIPLAEVTKDLESKFAKGLYFAGEMLDVDGQCGGFNLQWAFSSACAIAKSIAKEGGRYAFNND